jgi:hypothetical protein
MEFVKNEKVYFLTRLVLPCGVLRRALVVAVAKIGTLLSET